MPRRSQILALLLPALLVSTSFAEVVRVQIDRREPFAPGVDFGLAGPYERLTGRIYLAVGPSDSAN
ncbi:MAG: hypothetical protein EHM42_09455, partial [Planctomycetaceae bacterium]